MRPQVQTRQSDDRYAKAQEKLSPAELSRPTTNSEFLQGGNPDEQVGRVFASEAKTVPVERVLCDFQDPNFLTLFPVLTFFTGDFSVDKQTWSRFISRLEFCMEALRIPEDLWVKVLVRVLLW